MGMVINCQHVLKLLLCSTMAACCCGSSPDPLQMSTCGMTGSPFHSREKLQHLCKATIFPAWRRTRVMHTLASDLYFITDAQHAVSRIVNNQRKVILYHRNG